MSKVASPHDSEGPFNPDGYPCVPVSEIETYFRRVEGQVLTLLDATFAEPQQNKATKDIARAYFKDAMRCVYDDANLYEHTKYRQPTQASS